MHQVTCRLSEQSADAVIHGAGCLRRIGPIVRPRCELVIAICDLTTRNIQLGTLCNGIRTVTLHARECRLDRRKIDYNMILEMWLDLGREKHIELTIKIERSGLLVLKYYWRIQRDRQL